MAELINFEINNIGKGELIRVYSPSTGELIREVNYYTEEQAQNAVNKARIAQKNWGNLEIDKRIKILKNFQKILAKETDEICKLISLENGKPLQEALQTEVLTMHMLANYFIKKGKKFLADKEIPMHLIKYRRSFINYRPRGIIYIISPWNYPFAIPVGTIFLSLLAGNAVVHKPASLTPLIALKIRDLFDKAGLDKDLYQVIPCAGDLGSKIIEMGVNFVNFTGSTQVGLKISQICGKFMIPCSMELGGKNPAIICKDADIERTCNSIVFGALTNAGQTCASVGRVYAHESVYDKIVENITNKVKKFRVGSSDNSLKEADMGPMVDARQLKIVDEQVKDAISKGAKILTGGKKLERPGNFYAPTVIIDVTDEMAIMKEETFGPVIPITKFKSYQEVIQKANDSIYGLVAYVFCQNSLIARDLAKKLDAGTVMINETLITFGIPETPWQGVKMSGTGRTHSKEGLLSLCYPYHINEDSHLIKIKKNIFWQPYSNKTYERLKASIKFIFG